VKKKFATSSQKDYHPYKPGNTKKKNNQKKIRSKDARRAKAETMCETAKGSPV